MTRPRPRPQGRVPTAISTAAWLLLIVLICGGWAGCYAWSNNDCESRGGHTEWVWGSRAGWTCDGANR